MLPKYVALPPSDLTLEQKRRVFLRGRPLHQLRLAVEWADDHYRTVNRMDSRGRLRTLTRFKESRVLFHGLELKERCDDVEARS